MHSGQRRLAPPCFLSWRSRCLLAAPGAGELPADTDRLHPLEEAGAAAFAMLGQAPLQVLTGAQRMLGVLVGAIEVEHVHHHVSLLLGEGGGPSPSAWLGG